MRAPCQAGQLRHTCPVLNQQQGARSTHSLTGLGSAMVQGSEGRGHANQDDRWTRRRDKSAAPARHSRSQDTTGARPPPSPWPAVGRWPRRKREGSCGAERRWRGDQDQVDSRRENVCACSSAVGEYATSKFSNFSEKGKLTFCFCFFLFCESSPRMRRSILIHVILNEILT